MLSNYPIIRLIINDFRTQTTAYNDQKGGQGTIGKKTKITTSSHKCVTFESHFLNFLQINN